MPVGCGYGADPRFPFKVNLRHYDARRAERFTKVYVTALTGVLAGSPMGPAQYGYRVIAFVKAVKRTVRRK